MIIMIYDLNELMMLKSQLTPPPPGFDSGRHYTHCDREKQGICFSLFVWKRSKTFAEISESSFILTGRSSLMQKISP
jgi:hypothetical protein